MQSFPALFACAVLTAVSAAAIPAAYADTRIFIVANQPDGYGIDQCLARSELCGAPAARAYCRSQEFTQASAYRRLEPGDVTDAVALPPAACNHGGCGAYVAITCER